MLIPPGLAREFQWSTAVEKMVKNAEKSQNTARATSDIFADTKDVILQAQEFLEREKRQTEASDTPLLGCQFTVRKARDQELSDQKDFFIKFVDHFLVLGVFSDYEQQKKSNPLVKYVKMGFRDEFCKMISKSENIHTTLEKFIDQTQNELWKKREWSRFGTSVLIQIVDRKLNVIYSASIGAIRSVLYQSIRGETKVVNTVSLKNWSNPKESDRELKVLKKGQKSVSNWNSGPSARSFPTGNEIQFNRQIGMTGSYNRQSVKPFTWKAKIEVKPITSGHLVAMIEGVNPLNHAEMISCFKPTLAGSSEEIFSKITDLGAVKAIKDNISMILVKIDAEQTTILSFECNFKSLKVEQLRKKMGESIALLDHEYLLKFKDGDIYLKRSNDAFEVVTTNVPSSRKTIQDLINQIRVA